MLVKKDYLPSYHLLCLPQWLTTGGAHQTGLNRYLESTRVVVLTGQFLLNLRNLQQIPLTDQPGQLSNHCHVLRHSPRHLLELWVILNKGLP